MAYLNVSSVHSDGLLIAIGGGLAWTSPAVGAAPVGNANKIAFVRVVGQDDHIFVMNGDGTKPTDVSKSEGGDPAWSPDGTRIAFVSNRANGTNSQVYVMNTGGSHQTWLTHDSMPDRHPSWSPNGTKIVFAGDGGLFLVTLKTKAVRQLTQGPDSAPAWSPDGTRIAFERDRSVPNPTNTTGTDTEQDLWMMAADGSQARQLTSPPSFSVGTTTFAGEDNFPAWSPDGSKIAFESNRGSNNGIFVMSTDGTNIVALTHPQGTDEFPAWAPDGVRIAFDRAVEPVLSSKGQIYVMNADGSNQAALTNSSAGADSPAWQPKRA
jgi:Tol biopolymer transport system component